MSDPNETKAGSGCSAASCSLPDSKCDADPVKVLTRFMVAKEIVMSDGSRYFESCGSAWLDHQGNEVQSSEAWKKIQPFDSVERVSERWRLEGSLVYVWTEGVHGMPSWRDRDMERLPPLLQSHLGVELRELLTSQLDVLTRQQQLPSYND